VDGAYFKVSKDNWEAKISSVNEKILVDFLMKQDLKIENFKYNLKLSGNTAGKVSWKGKCKS
jgi:hypothetical protein